MREYPREFLELTGKRFINFWNADFYHYRWWETPVFLALSLLGLLGLIVALGNHVEGATLFGAFCYVIRLFTI